ncbi:hypothetical protein A9Q96_15800 [Rhodobacterales bacterium 52_120_T64]|nr:hypothetical protein A9Q96_15800 [Rhodobacterales bacterium 52_120_T64]
MTDALHIVTTHYGLFAMVTAFAVMLFAGFTKGAVGFGLPMICISGIGSVMPAEIAIAALILPGLITNMWQSLRNGFGPAWASLKQYWRLNLVLLLSIYAFAQLVVIIPETALFIILGVGITVFVSLQIVGWIPNIPARLATKIQAPVGLVAGFFGGLSGVWGPPILLYLLSQKTPKTEMVRVQGISFLVGAIVLTAAHFQSGLLNKISAPLSAWLIIPAVVGMAIGFKVHDRLDQAKFRKITLIVLAIAGLNLLRRGLFG